ncbi:hypothetical protein [Chondromyces crocatus]|uniref:PBP domain-containing protein n=1 Tax=Chondromyces crocatus TaxID=52 RepID=A0A0K1EGW7_CHOCO|nr:hypothetical protein [Chondromyces crocatus]AKT40100.1 uncharacterized protein CMC5_042530 [Chondromyces crocatus]
MVHRPRAPRRLGVAVMAALTIGTVNAAALAADCATLPSPIYGIGGSAPRPLFARLGQALSQATPPETFIYQAPGACHGPNYVIAGTRITGTASYWDAAGVEQTCDLPLTGANVDVGVANTFADNCPGIDALPQNVGDFQGPVNPFVFIVPKASSQTTISAAAAYFVYGFGETGQAQPWVDESQIIKRDPNSAAAIIIALAIGVPVERLKGVDALTNPNTVLLVSGSPAPERAIGFVSGEVAEANASVINVLAYQHSDQSCGYWPSSTATGFDKRNVRDGHYPLWGALHFFTRLGSNGAPTNPAAARLIGYFTGALPPPSGVDVPAITIAAGSIPSCAMRVQRDRDVGPLASFAPEDPCGCYFERVATGATTCQACTDSSECPDSAPACRRGYCEDY